MGHIKLEPVVAGFIRRVKFQDELAAAEWEIQTVRDVIVALKERSYLCVSHR